MVLVAKKSGEVRFCVDYRCLNSLTVPNIEDTLVTLGGCRHFCTMDQAGAGPGGRPRRDGLYEFNTTSFGLCNATATFERVMETVLRGLTWNICLVYVEDIVVRGPTVEETVRRLRLVWQRLREAGQAQTL